MGKDQRPLLDEMRQLALEQWTDNRSISADMADILLWFHLHLYADLSTWQCTYRGHSFASRDDEVLLVLKVTQKGIPRVVFVSHIDTIRCVSKLRRLLRDGGVKFYDDKYA